MQRNFGSLFCVKIGDGDVDERVAGLRLYCSGIWGLEDDGMLCVKRFWVFFDDVWSRGRFVLFQRGK